MIKPFFSLLFFFTFFHPLQAQELFLAPTNFFALERSTVQFILLNENHHDSNQSIARNRIVKDQVIGPDFKLELTTRNYNDIDSLTTVLSFETGKKGTYLIGLSVLGRIISSNQQTFDQYLADYGNEALVKKRQEEGTNTKEVTELHQKHVKSLFQVGTQKSDHYNQKLGYPLEFIPLTNPYSLAVGQEMAIRLELKNGMVLKDQPVFSKFRKVGAEAVESTQILVTDQEGVIRFPISASGDWYIASIYFKEHPSNKLDYESIWTSLTFSIR